MKKFVIYKEFKTEKDNINILVIHVHHILTKDKWKDRYLIFNSESTTYKNERKKQCQNTHNNQ